MSGFINIYCDESCHLENDRQKSMVLGAVWVPEDKRREASARIREVLTGHGMPLSFEAKWTKVSPAKRQMYMDIIDYFFDNDDLHFRCLVIPDKRKIDHRNFNQSHDDWYYKMYFTMLKSLFKPGESYCIYLDIKDTRSREKVKKLHDVLCNNAYDFSREMIKRVQQVRSNEVLLVQLADILVGAMSYRFRGQNGSSTKLDIIEMISRRSGYSLDRSTLLREEKFNIFVWHGQEV
jgi:hypothetical protein